MNSKKDMVSQKLEKNLIKILATPNTFNSMHFIDEEIHKQSMI